MNKKISDEAKAPVAAVAPVQAPAAPDEFPIDLNEFCARLSGTDRRVELISGFHHAERSAGRVTDLPSAYTRRFGEFQTRPVN